MHNLYIGSRKILRTRKNIIHLKTCIQRSRYRYSPTLNEIKPVSLNLKDKIIIHISRIRERELEPLVEGHMHVHTYVHVHTQN